LTVLYKPFIPVAPQYDVSKPLATGIDFVAKDENLGTVDKAFAVVDNGLNVAFKTFYPTLKGNEAADGIPTPVVTNTASINGLATA